MRSFIFCTHPQILLGRSEQIKENEVGGHVARIGEETVQGFGGKARMKEPTWKTRRIWRMGLECILWRLAGGVEWIQLTQDRVRWRAVVNTVMKLCVLSPRS
jgi:hypothetical protein